MFCFEIPTVMGSGEFLLQAGLEEAVGEKGPGRGPKRRVSFASAKSMSRQRPISKGRRT